MNLANSITVMRILLIPVFLGFLMYYRNIPHEEWLRVSALIVFSVAVLSDALDGFIARTFHQRTVLGTFLDPLADKMLIISAIIMLTIPSEGLGFRLPFWFCVLVLSRDAFIVLGALLIHMIEGRVQVVPRFLGKATTFFQMLTIIWILLRIDYQFVPVFISAAFTVLSGIEYIIIGSRQLNGKNASEAT